jgi:hypothetical protein
MNIGLQPVTDKLESEETVAVSSHKKRKKAKHSKEPGSKRRKLHAEISSDQNDESLKLKVKITGSKPHKHERKSSSGEAPAKKEKIEESPQIVEEDVIEEKPQIGDLDAGNKEKEKLLELRSVRHKPMVIIPNLNRSLSEGCSTITNLIKNIQSKEANRNTAKKDVDSKTLTPPPMSSFSFAAKKFPNTPSSLQVPPKSPSPHVFKTPTSLTPPLLPPKVSSPNIMDSSQRLTNNSLQNRVFSPRHTPSYPTFNFAKNVPASPRLSPISAPGSGMQIYRSNNVALKRSSSIDSSPQLMAKQPRLNMMEINAQNRLMKKPVYAQTMTKPPVTIASKPSGPIVQPKVTQNQSSYPFTGGVTRKLAQHSPILAKPITTATKSNDFCFKSSIGTASYTQENLNKKPLPILLPPSSISVTKMTDNVQQLTPAGPMDNRPALEIVAIPHTASVVDQQKPVATSFGMITTTTQNNAKLNVPKTTRPPPPTIPLVKIKRPQTLQLTSPVVNSLSMLAATVKIPSSSPTQPKNGIETSPKPVKRTNESDGNAPLDLSGKSTRSPTHESVDSSKATDPSTKTIKPTDNGHEKAKPASPNDIKRIEESLAKKPSQTIPNLTAYKTTSYTTTIPGMPRQLPLPKLNEINKLSTVRQQNPSVRNIPNPSALAFRNQVQPSTTMKTSESNTSTSNSATACSSAKPLTTFGSPTTTSSMFSSITSTSSTVTSTKSIAGMSNLSNNNNSFKTNLQKSNETQQLVAKKNLSIEQVAAGLRAKSSNSANSSVNVV